MSKKYALYKYPPFSAGKKKTKRNQGYTVDKLNEVIDPSYFSIEFQKHCFDYPFTPPILPLFKRIIVMGDIHGDYELTMTMFSLANLIKINKSTNKIQWIGEDTVVVQVGDQIDRCRPIGNMTCDLPNTTYKDESSDIKLLKLFTDLDIQARKANGMVISLLGNHELLNAEGNLTYVSYKNIEEFKDYKDPKNPNKRFSSGNEARVYAFRPGNEYAKFLGCTRLPAVIIGNLLFVHAGIIDRLIRELKINKSSDLNTINIAIKKWLLGLISKEYVDKIISANKYSMFWNRILGQIPPNINLEDDMCIKHIDETLKLFNVGHIIIGHTPQSFLYSSGINGTCIDHINNTKKIIKSDVGSSNAFGPFDEEQMRTNINNPNRDPQILEIINGNIFNIIKKTKNGIVTKKL